ncbi:MAG: zinc-finger domain-containing protein [Gammaproteobacteria bacterium]|nr:MAG: zinc-finger domain-containing protein [Gammaproteobacteria bacterium]
MTAAEQKQPREVEIGPDALPLHCPGDNAPLWAMHPRVYLPLENGRATCPYCGTTYRLKSK